MSSYINNLAIIVITVAIAGAVLLVREDSKKSHAWDSLISGNDLPKEPLAKPVHVKANLPIEFDFKTKKEIYDIRKKYVHQYPELAPKEYKPSEVIFGNIIDGKPWWGELGESYYGPGANSNEGMSEESRYLVNPYILIGIDSFYSFPCSHRMSRPVPVSPVALEMIWETRTKAHAYFDIKRFRDINLRCGYSSSQVMKLHMVAYNARDFGYNYLAVDLSQSENIGAFAATQNPQQIKQFIHCGTSCGRPEGCNNMSPHLPETTLPYKGLPAKAYVKLWKGKPDSINSLPDFTYVLYMM